MLHLEFLLVVQDGLSSVRRLKNACPRISKQWLWAKESLQRLRDRAISISETSRIKDEWSHNFLRTEQLVMFDCAVMAYKIMNRLCPENFWNKFQRRSQYSSYNTRFCRDLQIPWYNLEYAKKGFSYSALKVWNEIPISIRELPTLCQFKKQLKTHLMSWKPIKHDSLEDQQCH